MQETVRVTVMLIISLLITAGVMALSGKNPWEAYSVLFTSALGNPVAIADTLLVATPLIFSGLATAISFRAGIFNIGVEGSLYLGAFAAAWVAFTFTHLPGALLVFLAFLLAGVVGGIWLLVPGYLKAYLNVDEIVTTIMLNYVAIFFTSYLVNYPFAVPGLANAMSLKIAKQAMLTRLLPPSQFNISFFVAIAAVVAIWLLFSRSTLGFELGTLGLNPVFAHWSGMPSAKVILKVMFISGFLGGLAGAGQVLGVNYRFVANFSPGYGFDGIAIALLANNNPWGSFLSALLFGVLRNGGATMELLLDIPLEIVRILEGTIILFVTAQFAFSKWPRRAKQ